MPKLPYTIDAINLTEVKKLNKYTIKQNLLKHCKKFTNVNVFARSIAKTGTWADYIAIEGISFTMEEFDENGEYMNWYNKLLGVTVKIKHRNRYNNPRDITLIEVYKQGCYRNDISFLE